MRPWILPTLSPLAATVLALAGIIALGQSAQEDLRSRQQYHVSFFNIQCEPPASMTRSEFLGEVQYEAETSDQLNPLDVGLPARLAAVFARHPWVERVERIEVRPNGQIEAQFTFRQPVLAIHGPE